MHRPAVIRHLFSVTATAAFVVGLAVLVTLPVAGVFLLDSSFVATDYLKFVLSAVGVGVGLSLLVMLPLAVVLEYFCAKLKVLAVIPFAVALGAGACVVVRVAVTKEVLDTVFGWAGLSLALSVIFAFYWVALWVGRTIASGLHKLRRQEITTRLGR